MLGGQTEKSQYDLKAKIQKRFIRRVSLGKKKADCLQKWFYLSAKKDVFGHPNHLQPALQYGA